MVLNMTKKALIVLIASLPMVLRLTAQSEDPLALNYHLMHPGEASAPGDPNAAFYLDGTYHLHYILRHKWQGKNSFSFIHVTSPDMLHWIWQPTKLQPSFTGHGMFSGTAFMTREGRLATIYHGQSSGRNQITVAGDRNLSAWEKPYPVEVFMADGSKAEMRNWDPDCFLIGDVYYAISGGVNPPLFKSNNLKDWTYVGPFVSQEPSDVVMGEDISCANFFPIGDKWMLLCISHPYGCRYYIGEWDKKAEQFVPEQHVRMNWPQKGQMPARNQRSLQSRDFFAPESVLTPDGRRVMWAWLATVDETLREKTIQSLPRELSLLGDGSIRIQPLRELETLRYDQQTIHDLTIKTPVARKRDGQWHRIAELPGEACEIRVSIPRSEVERKHFGIRLFAFKDDPGLPILFKPSTGTLLVGTTEAPFAVADLPTGEDMELRIFIDKYLVEVFVNGRQAVVAAHMDWQSEKGIDGFSFGEETLIDRLDIWKLNPTNQGYLDARQNRIWEPDAE